MQLCPADRDTLYQIWLVCIYFTTMYLSVYSAQSSDAVLVALWLEYDIAG